MADSQENIKRKIRGLDSLRRGAGTEAEAKAAAHAIAQLLRKHNLELGACMIEAAGPHDECALALPKKPEQSTFFCVQAVAKLLDVGFFWFTFDRHTKASTRQYHAVMLYGAVANVLAATACLRYFVRSVKSLTAGSPYSDTRQHRIEYSTGVGYRLQEEVVRYLTERPNPTPQERHQSTAIVLATDRMQMEYRRKHKNFFTGLKVKTSVIEATEAMTAGYLDGESIDIHGAQQRIKHHVPQLPAGAVK